MFAVISGSVVLYFFRHMPSHASREVLIIYGSLTTCDPGDILETVKVSKLVILVCCSVFQESRKKDLCTY